MTSLRMPCPKCREEGRDSKGDHLKPWDDGRGGWCFHGHGSVFFDEGGRYEQKEYQRVSQPVKDEVPLILSYPFLEYPARMISKETFEHFGVRTGVSMETGEPAEHYYPYYHEGSITGFKRRLLPKKGFSWVGKAKSLFGWDKVVGRKFIIVVEGEQDVLACHEMMKKLKPDRPPYNVVSIPNGASEPNDDGVVNIDKTVKRLLPSLAEFETVVLCLDMDVPGQETANMIADYLCSSTTVKMVSLPLKDSAAMWEEGREKEWASAINNARKFVTDSIVCGSDDVDSLFKPLNEGIQFSFLPKTGQKLHGFRKGEMHTLIAPPNVGKSSLYRQCLYEGLVSLPDTVFGGLFLEETTRKTRQSIVAYHADTPLNRFRESPFHNHATKEATELLLPRLHLYEHKTQVISDDVVLRKIEFMVKALGAEYVLLDHLGFIIGAMKTENERRAIDVFLTKLARSVEEWNYGLFLVSHIKRGEKEQSRSGKEKYPYWEILDMDDARGSGAIEQLSHNLIALERQVLDPSLPDTRGFVRTRLLRNREWGTIGTGDILTFDHRGKFITAPATEY